MGDAADVVDGEHHRQKSYARRKRRYGSSCTVCGQRHAYIRHLGISRH
ncbi:hypothetical protein K8374_09080 [Pseudomonas sp. p1(2021b)]|nr:hypothetical protein K8374_09080 [Pseudomonas sp. p1(2021b)]